MYPGIKTKYFIFVDINDRERAVMAEAVFNRAAGYYELHAYSAVSRGLCVYENALPTVNTYLCCSDMGLDVSKHTAKRITENEVSQAQAVLAMNQIQKKALQDIFPHRENIYTLTEYANSLTKRKYVFSEDILDPYGGKMQTYEKVYKEIERNINIIVKNLINMEDYR